MSPNDLVKVQEIIKKALVRPRDLHYEMNRDEVANHFFEQQGINKALKVIQNIIDGKYDLKQMEEE